MIISLCSALQGQTDVLLLLIGVVASSGGGTGKLIEVLVVLEVLLMVEVVVEGVVVVEVMMEAMEVVVVEVMVVMKVLLMVEAVTEALVVLEAVVSAVVDSATGAVLAAGTLTLSERVQRQAGLTRLDGEQALPLQVEQMLLLDLLDLQELLLEGQLLRRHLLLVARTRAHRHANTCTTQMERQQGTPLVNIIIYESRANTQKATFQVCTSLDNRLFSKKNRTFFNPLCPPRHNPTLKRPLPLQVYG